MLNPKFNVAYPGSGAKIMRKRQEKIVIFWELFSFSKLFRFLKFTLGTTPHEVLIPVYEKHIKNVNFQYLFFLEGPKFFWESIFGQISSSKNISAKFGRKPLK